MHVSTDARDDLFLARNDWLVARDDRLVTCDDHLVARDDIHITVRTANMSPLLLSSARYFGVFSKNNVTKKPVLT